MAKEMRQQVERKDFSGRYGFGGIDDDVPRCI